MAGDMFPKGSATASKPCIHEGNVLQPLSLWVQPRVLALLGWLLEAASAPIAVHGWPSVANGVHVMLWRTHVRASVAGWHGEGGCV